MEAGIGGLRHEVMDAVAELVEERDHFVMFKKTGLFRGRLGEVADKSCRGVTPRAVLLDESLNRIINK